MSGLWVTLSFVSHCFGPVLSSMFDAIYFKTSIIYINQWWKWNPCLNDNSKPLSRGTIRTKSPVSISGEKVQPNQDPVYF